MEDVGVGLVTDGHKESGCGNHVLFPGDVVFHLHAVHGLFAKNLHGLGVVQHFNVFEAVDAVLHGLGGAHHIAADEHRDFGAEFREIARFFTGTVTRPHDDHFLIAVEESVAHGAGTHTAADVAKAQLTFEAKPLGRGACADDHRVGVDFRFQVVAHPNLVHRSAEVHLGHPTVPHIGVEALGLVFEVLHHLGSVDASRVARKVVDFCRLGKLTAWLLPLVQDGFHVRAGGVNGGSVSGGA